MRKHDVCKFLQIHFLAILTERSSKSQNLADTNHLCLLPGNLWLYFREAYSQLAHPTCSMGGETLHHSIALRPPWILSKPFCYISWLVITHPAVYAAILMGNRANPFHLSVVMKNWWRRDRGRRRDKKNQKSRRDRRVFLIILPVQFLSNAAIW